MGNKIPVDYRSVAFCYADRGFGKDDLNEASGEYPQPGTVKFHNTQLQVLSFRNGGLISERMENADRIV